MASQKAKQIDFLIAGYANSSGQPYKAGKVYFWESSSKTTKKTVWQDRNKANAYSQPVVLGNRGEATVFGDGEYYIEIYDKNDVLVKTLDLINYSAEVDFGGLYIDVASLYGTSGPNIQAAIDDLETTLNYVLLFKDADFAVSQNITLPSNVVLKAMPTANIEVAQSITLNINGFVDAGDYEVFSGQGTVNLEKNENIGFNWASGVTINWKAGHYTLAIKQKYRRPNLVWASNSTVTVQTALYDGTSGQASVLFPDGELRHDSNTDHIIFDITQNADFQGEGLQAGLKAGTSESANTWYAIYAVKCDDSSSFVLVGDSLTPKPSNIATLNTTYGKNSWVYLGLIRNGDNVNYQNDIVDFSTSGDTVLFKAWAGINNYGGGAPGFRVLSATATGQAYSHSSGMGASDTPDTIEILHLVARVSLTADYLNIEYLNNNKDSNRNAPLFRAEVSSEYVYGAIWMPIKLGVWIGAGSSANINLWVNGFKDPYLGVN